MRKSHGATRGMRRKTKQGDRGGGDGNKSGAGGAPAMEHQGGSGHSETGYRWRTENTMLC